MATEKSETHVRKGPNPYSKSNGKLNEKRTLNQAKSDSSANGSQKGKAR
jgi:hypothetical protein